MSHVVSGAATSTWGKQQMPGSLSILPRDVVSVKAQKRIGKQEGGTVLVIRCPRYWACFLRSYCLIGRWGLAGVGLGGGCQQLSLILDKKRLTLSSATLASTRLFVTLILKDYTKGIKIKNTYCKTLSSEVFPLM